MDREEIQSARSAYVRKTHDVAEELAEELESIPPSVDNWDTQSDLPSVQFAHNILLRYAGRVAPKSSDLRGDLWEEVLDHVTVPKPGQRVDCGRTNAYGEIDLDNVDALIETTTVPLSLEGLDWWRQKNQIDIICVADGGDTVRRLRQTHHLPLAGIRLLQSQLNQCIDDLGWLGEAAEEDYEEEEVLA